MRSLRASIVSVVGTVGSTMATSSVINTSLITGLIDDVVVILPKLVDLIVATLPIVIIGIFVYLIRDTIKSIADSISKALKM